MWKNRLLCLGLVLCLLLAGCSAQRGESESSQSSELSSQSSEPGSQSSESGSQTSEPVEEKPALPIQDSTGWSEGMAQIVETAAEYFIEQRDGVSDGELTEADVTRLWYLVNTIYDADDVAFADEMAAPPEGVPAGILSKFVDFDEATRYLFTSHGLEQLLSAEMAGEPYIYQAENGEVYHRGPYKTGYSYQNAMTGYRVVSSSPDSAQVEVSWRIAAPLDWEGERPEAFTTLVLKREDNRWKVDSYNFPEASYPEEFTITEEIRVKLTDTTQETTLSDAAEKEQIVARLRELTLGTVVQEAPAQDCIAIEAVDDGAVYHRSVAPDGRVWDTLYADGEWVLYQADPSFYQELQSLLA